MTKNNYILIKGVISTISLIILISSNPIANADSFENVDALEAVVGQSIADDLLLAEESSQVIVVFKFDASPWHFSPLMSPSLKQGTLIVNSKGSWRVSAISDTGGYMKEIKGNTYVPSGKTMHNPLTVFAEGGNRIDLSQGGILIEGFGDKTIPITLEQHVVMSDEALPMGHFYGSEISFIGSIL